MSDSPDLVRLEALSALFESTLNPLEQKMFMLYMLVQSCKMMGVATVEEMVRHISESDCEGGCPMCAETVIGKQVQEILDAFQAAFDVVDEAVGSPHQEEEDEDDDGWSEVIH